MTNLRAGLMAQGQTTMESLQLAAVWQFVLRYWRWLAGGILLGIIIAVIYALKTPAQFSAKALLQLDSRQTQVVNVEAVVSGIALDEAAVRSEIDVLRSRRLLGVVVDELNLTQDPTFNPDLREQGLGAKLLGILRNRTELDPIEQAARERRKAISILQEYLIASAQPRSYTIAIRATAYSPQQAAELANTLMEAYLSDQLETKFAAAERANTWLDERLQELRTQVAVAEEAVQRFRNKHDLVEAKGVTLTDQQLAELNTQLILARTERAQAAARLRAARNQASGDDSAASSAVLSSQLIQRLREQEAEVVRKEADLAGRYGPRHPRMINVRTELRDLQAKIDDEISKVVRGLENDLQIAQSRERSLAAQLNNLQQNQGERSLETLQLAELEREMRTSQALYESFLARFKETSEVGDFQQSDARIISEAEPPLLPSAPNKKLILLLGIILGAMGGITAAFVRQQLDVGYRSADQLESQQQVPVIGQIPELSPGVDLLDYLASKPTSAYAEALRTVRTAVQFANPDEPPKVLLVTSSVPQEGKSQFAGSLAQVLAQAGHKILLIDGDLRRSRQAAVFGVEPKYSIANVLLGEVSLKDALVKEQRSGLHILPAKTDTPNSQDLLASQKMADLLAELRGKYELIIIDCPPVLAVADSHVLLPQADTVLFMVRWGHTRRDLVQTALTQLQRQLEHINTRFAGAVLTRVDLAKHAAYGYGDRGYAYHVYGSYYHR